ncbi:hypothetical protein [Flavobacterium sp.]|uniref:hypothetical protein n=1 Tax=Flavobacterium sp. TaxID=239 RepID=UPI00286E5E4C|nr:hypothetical protein [Flavobacterium sp.]
MRYLFFLVLSNSFCFGQIDSVKIETQPKFDAEFRMKIFHPIHFGSNFLAESNKSNFSFGLNLDVLEYRNFIFGGGIDYSHYNVTDVTRAGDVKTTKLKNFYINLSYKQPLTDKIDFMPNIGVGYSVITYSEYRFGNQNGNNFRIGFNVDYKLNETLCLFAGTTFIYNKYTINTSPEFVSFYDNSKILQLIIGLKIY